MASADPMIGGTSDEDEKTGGSDSGYGSSVKGPDTHWVPVCCTASRMCHVCYIFLFLTYMVVFPLWCKWLLTAPMPFNYWGQEYPDFPRMPLMYTGIAQKGTNDQQQIDISPIPKSQSACNYTCASDLHGYRTSEMNFDITLSMNKSDLGNMSHTTYPVILTSEDFEHWMLAADRRDASPRVFFDQVTPEDGRMYTSVQDRCSKPTASSYTDHKTYVIACVSWRSLKDLEGEDSTLTPTVAPAGAAADSADGWTNAQIAERCDVIGGVCGWPCNADLPMDTVAQCSKNGVIDQSALDKILGTKPKLGNVTVKGCTDASSTVCETSTEGMSAWPCPSCVRRAQHTDDRRRLQVPMMPPIGLPPGMEEDEDVDGDGDVDAADESADHIYRSLPRFWVQYDHYTMANYPDVVSRLVCVCVTRAGQPRGLRRGCQAKVGRCCGLASAPRLAAAAGG